MRDLERRVVLSVVGRKWQEHLYEMDYLKEGIGLRAMAQRDPLVEYQREGYAMFEAMMESIREESVSLVFHAEVEPGEGAEQAQGAGLEEHQEPSTLGYSGPDEDGAAETSVRRTGSDGQDEASDQGAGSRGSGKSSKSNSKSKKSKKSKKKR
jgi:preprotein translocase subunit SecA